MRRWKNKFVIWDGTYYFICIIYYVICTWSWISNLQIDTMRKDWSGYGANWQILSGFNMNIIAKMISELFSLVRWNSGLYLWASKDHPVLPHKPFLSHFSDIWLLSLALTYSTRHTVPYLHWSFPQFILSYSV